MVTANSLSLSLSLSLSVVHAYDVTLRASKKREQELQEQLNAAQRDSQEMLWSWKKMLYEHRAAVKLQQKCLTWVRS